MHPDPLVHREQRYSRLDLLTHSALLGALLIAISLLFGCGGSSSTSASSGSGPSPTPTPTPAAKTTVQMNIGDSPADWMLGFSANITSMSLTGSGGSSTVLSTATPVEMMHLMGTMQPIVSMAIPQGTYTGASVSVGSATVTYMDPTLHQVMQKTIAGPTSATITFSSPVTVGSAPMSMNFDLDLGASVSVASDGSMTMSPVFHVTTGTPGSGNPSDFLNGGVQQMMGIVSSTSATSFTMSSMQAALPFTFMTNSSTTYDTGTAGAMNVGMMVLVDAQMQSDGTLLASHVRSMMGTGGMMGGGIVTATTGSPVTSLTLVMQNGAGNGMMSTYFANGVTVNLGSSTTFTIDKDFVDLSGLPFTPAFDASHLYAGQSVMPISTSAMMAGGGMGGGMGGMGGGMSGSMMAGTITASGVYLMPQGLSGTASAAITSGSASSFTLTLPSDCAFTTLTGASTVLIYQQPSTYVPPASGIVSGTKVHAFGLLFFDQGQWKMVAARIAAA